MPFLYQVTVAAALLALGCATPIANRRDVGFSVTEVAKNVGFLKSGPRLMAETYLKFGKEMPTEVSNAAATTSGTVVANPTQYDSEYVCSVTVGGQTMRLDFDTGSSDLWVFSTEQPSSQTSGHNLYNPAKSSTSSVDSGATWSISYGDGSSSSGDVYFDTVSVGASTVTSMAVEAAKTVSSSFVSDTDIDGLLGLALDSINTVSPNQVRTFFFHAIAEGLPQAVFTANLKKGAPGNYNFGYIDSSEYSGSLTYVPVNTANGFWEFTSNGYAVGSGSFVSSSIDSIADTGTTLLYLPAAVVKAYYAKVAGSSNSASAGGYIFPCSATLPSITLGIGSYKAVVPGSYMNYAPNSGSTCFGGIQSNTGFGFSIFGDIFLKSQFVVFNAVNANAPTLGFAPKA
ncbi:Type I transmembrane sorting receptor [Lambiella insularis]|nr:Type I transmembrane sorting receptor [Lambiella insularis]